MQPFCELEFDGAPSALVSARLISATVTLESGKEPDRITVRLADPFARLPRPREGARISCTMGYIEGARRTHGPFVVDWYGGGFEEEDGEYLEITGTSVDFRSGIKNRASRTYKNKTLGEILETEAQKEGLSAIISPELSAIQYPHFVRSEQSLMQMVGELAEIHDAVEKYKDGTLYFLSRAKGVDLSGAFLGHTLTRDDLKGWHWGRDFRNNYAGVKASSRNHDKGVREVVTEPLKDSDAFYEIRKEFPTKELAQTAAKSKAKQLGRSERTIEFTCKAGDPSVLEQVILTFEEVSPEATGEWIVTQAVHDFDADNEAYSTSGSAEMKE